MLQIDKVQIILASGSAENDEVVRNAKVILSTFEGTVPFDRSFGISQEVLDAPLNEAEGIYTVECITKLRRYEPRANVESITFENDFSGNLKPKVVLSIES